MAVLNSMNGYTVFFSQISELFVFYSNPLCKSATYISKHKHGCVSRIQRQQWLNQTEPPRCPAHVHQVLPRRGVCVRAAIRDSPEPGALLYLLGPPSPPVLVLTALWHMRRRSSNSRPLPFLLILLFLKFSCISCHFKIEFPKWCFSLSVLMSPTLTGLLPGSSSARK